VDAKTKIVYYESRYNNTMQTRLVWYEPMYGQGLIPKLIGFLVPELIPELILGFTPYILAHNTSLDTNYISFSKNVEIFNSFFFSELFFSKGK
jgi:hypothetical protein